ncbi:unknown [Anaerotruncus sp. CAG:390]|nr:unknown [Anaerotruncus sp. CAG:390]
MDGIKLIHVFGVFIEKTHEFLFVKACQGKHGRRRLKLFAFFIARTCHKAEVAVSGAVNENVGDNVDARALADHRHAVKLAVFDRCITKFGVK